MSYTYLSLQKSDEIYHLVINLSIQHTLEKFFISKLELKGYNFIDISNAFKLQIAIKYFFNSENHEDIKNFAGSCDTTLADFSERVIPDEVYENLTKYDHTSIHYDLKEDELRKITVHRRALIEEFESCVSFLEFCEGLAMFSGNSKLNDYLKKVYSHLNLHFCPNEFKKIKDG